MRIRQIKIVNKLDKPEGQIFMIRNDMGAFFGMTEQEINDLPKQLEAFKNEPDQTTEK